MKVNLNTDLIPTLVEDTERSRKSFIATFLDVDQLPGSNWTSPFYQKNLLVREDIPEDNITHRNYLDYLARCWQNHFGIILSPDQLWYGLLCEIAILIKANPNQYRALFTNSDEKKLITVLTDDPEVIPMDSIIAELKRLVPTDTEAFLPTFSTTTEKAIFAHSVAFADAVSPYYDYMMYMCGIRSVTILGTPEDWQKIRDQWVTVTNVLSLFNDWTSRVGVHLKALHEVVDGTPNDEFLKNIFHLKRCGSGGQVEVGGWYKDFFVKNPSPSYTHNFSSHISEIKYKNLSTGKNYVMSSGIFSSKVVDGDLVPEYNMVVVEVLDKPQVLKTEEENNSSGFSMNVISVPITAEPALLGFKGKDIITEGRIAGRITL